MSSTTRGLLIILGIVLIAYSLSGCASGPCQAPEAVMANKGMVLECRKNSTKYPGETATECLIGRMVCAKECKWEETWHTVFKRHCGQYE